MEEIEEYEDEFEEDDFDFYICLSCGNIQFSELSCKKCNGPVTGYYH